jgi:hypothetical protein
MGHTAMEPTKFVSEGDKTGTFLDYMAVPGPMVTE